MQKRIAIAIAVSLIAIACSDSELRGVPGVVDAGDAPTDETTTVDARPDPAPDPVDVRPDGGEDDPDAVDAPPDLLDPDVHDVPEVPDVPDVPADPLCAPSDPTCDGVDDDCDTVADDDYVPYLCGVGACARSSVCIAGAETCTPGTPTGDDSDCDAVDDDCDGLVDEHYLPYFCGTGGCMWPSTCVSGFENCTPRSPSPDTNCDGIDDDCDGAVDDDYIPYTCGWGTCMATSVCVGGVESCTPPYDSSLWPGIWTVYEMDVVTEMNAERLAGASCRGTWYAPVAALTMSVELHDAARCHSLDMSSHDFLRHTGSDGSGFSTRCTSAGYMGTVLGENVAAGPATAAAVVASWMASTSGECEMIMDPGAREVGVGYSYDSSATWVRYWTADFGHP